MAILAPANRAESLVEDCCRRGLVADFATLPQKDIRADFVRSLVLGRLIDTEIAPIGIAIHGADILGELDLSRSASAAVPLPALDLANCTVKDGLDLSDSCWTSIALNNCMLGPFRGQNIHLQGGFSAEGLRLFTSQSITLRGLHAGGDVIFSRLGRTSATEDSLVISLDLGGSRIGGSLKLLGATLSATDKDALSLEGAEVSGDVILEADTIDVSNHRFEAVGLARLRGIKVNGQISCVGARFQAKDDGLAIDLESANVAGGLFMEAEHGASGRRFEAIGQVAMAGIRVGSSVSCIGAKFDAAPTALSLDGAEVAGDVFLQTQDADNGHRFEATGTVRILGAKIAGQLACDGAKFDGQRSGIALFADGADVRGDVFLRKEEKADGHRCETIGSVRLLGVKIGGQLSCIGAKFETDGTCNALALDNAEITDDVLLRAQPKARFEANGGVRLFGTTVGGTLNCEGALITADEHGDALYAEGLRIRGAMTLRDVKAFRFEARGAIRLSDASIGGNLDLHGALLTNPAGRALSMSRGKIEGDVLFRANERSLFEAFGEVRLAGGTGIGGRLDCAGARFVNPSNEMSKRALALWNLTIGRDLQFRSLGDRRTEIDGRVYGFGLKVGGSIECKGLRADFPQGIALDFENASVGSDVLFETDGKFATEISGSVKLSDCRIGGSVCCDRVGLGNAFTALPSATFTDGRSTQPADCVFDLTRTSITGAIIARFDADHTAARVRLVGAHAGELDDLGGDGWGKQPQRDQLDGRLRGSLLELDGFTYNRLASVDPGDAAPASPPLETWTKRVNWLNQQFVGNRPQPQDFFPQPHEQLARALRLAGHGYDARRILMHKLKHESICREDNVGIKALMGLFEWLFGYGYLPINAFVTCVGWLVFGSVLTVIALCQPDILVRSAAGVEVVRSLTEPNARPHSPTPDPALDPKPLGSAGYGVYPAVSTRDIRCLEIDPVLYALDTMLPVVDLHMEEKCEVADDKTAYRWVKALYAMIGWIIVALATLTWTGVLRREPG